MADRHRRLRRRLVRAGALGLGAALLVLGVGETRAAGAVWTLTRAREAQVAPA